ncbi:hypothetical protein BT63DRAFT_9230 [Microthyrium microscopicum]|uniref:Uncharacterized protein n=1 Tax=Microthyrium microscopicum TaxID=703497 RepID=A0A6A6URL6_9PEZI|nr:hypothetical protein BT63DRAFT_9230 [Microthyrium microscopicum]
MNRLPQLHLSAWPSLKQYPATSFVFRFLSIPNILILLWLYVVYWSERTVFTKSIQECQWDQWETFPAESSPHHVAFIADPQIVDPHTYPGRPWPLSTLTVMYTDSYLRRTYSLIQQQLYPDTTVFLGDLFDGGREWSTSHSSSPEKRYKKYGEKFWHKEYVRFAGMFFKTWLNAGVIGREGQPSRRQILSNLPGNHDLGFASGIQEPVRNRFNAYFGDGNSIDVIGNHTFVSIDTVSLSAKEDAGAEETLWEPAQSFLDGFSGSLDRVLGTHMALQLQKHRGPVYDHKVVDTDDLESDQIPDNSFKTNASFPMVLLTHVPLYREPGTPCGPMRERWPQSKDASGKLLDVDDRNAIVVHRGYQYQNVLSEDLSKEIASKLENVSHAFSGDDHDYCELVHRRYPSAGSGIREITVKSISWAMGVRKPGFQLLSLWNPINEEGASIKQGGETEGTLQTKLCLLPDQLGLFILYAKVLAFSLIVLATRAMYLMLHPELSTLGLSSEPLLPLARSASQSEIERAASSSSDDGSGALTTRSRLSVKQEGVKSRGASPKPSSGYGLPADQYIPLSSKQAPSNIGTNTIPQSRFRGRQMFVQEFRWSLFKVALVVLPWYSWLLYRG